MLDILRKLFEKPPAMFMGTGPITGWQKKKGFHYLYLGCMEDEPRSPICWRVLSTEGNGGNYQETDGRIYTGSPIFLLSDDLLGDNTLGGGTTICRNRYIKFYEDDEGGWNRERPASVWQNSDARKWCRRMAKRCFSEPEGAAILATFKDDPEYHSWRDTGLPANTPPVPAAPGILDGDHIFFLSDEEAERQDYGFPHKKSYTAGNEWWTRSYDEDNYHSPRYVQVGIVITSYGGLLRSPASKHMRFFARPALNLNPGAVLFVSAAMGGKPTLLPDESSEPATLLPIPPAPKGKHPQWKLTLHDRSRDSFEAGPARREKGALAIPYRGAVPFDKDAAPGERVSAILTDNNGQQLKRYGVLSLPRKPEGEVWVRIDNDWKAGDRLFLFSEQLNGDRRSDYASRLTEIEVTQ